MLKKYHNPHQIGSILQKWENDFPDIAKIISIGKSAGQYDLTILRVAAQGKNRVDPDYRPAVFVCANIEGVHLVGTEAALFLAEKLLTSYGTDQKITAFLERKTVYIMPVMNPDAAAGFLEPPHFLRYSNDQPVDDDLDGKIDEDQPDDLNRDGVITKMRIKDPGGFWKISPDEPRLMGKILQKSGNPEIYSIYPEGRDDDGDGKYNEDPKGGIELFRNFPHSFEYNVQKATIWPDSTNETASLITFLVGHENISLVLNFSLENTFPGFPNSNTNGMKENKITLPENFAGSLGLDSGKEYSLEDLIEILKKSRLAATGWEIDETTAASLLGLRPVNSIDSLDRPFFSSIQDEYKRQLENFNLVSLADSINGIVKGSFLSYCYFHLGVPVFSANLYAVPENPRMEAPAANNPDSRFLKWSDEFLQGKGFVQWQPFNHPDLGNVEIGGFNPFLKFNPPLDLLKESILFYAGFYINLMTHLADLQIKETKVRKLNAGLYKVTVHFSNPGWFPTATAYGRKKLHSPPIIVRLKTTKEQMIYAGESFEVIDFIGERDRTKTLEWILKGKPGSVVIVTAESPKVGLVTSTIVLE